MGLQPRQARHLRAALDLEHAYGIGLLQCVIHCGIIGRQFRQIHLFPVVIADQRNRIFQHRHHSQPQQVHLDDAHVGAIFLVPLHDDAAGHGRGFQRNDGIKLPLADDHTAGVLPQMTRQVLHRDAKLEELAHARMPQVKAGIVKLPLQRVAGIFVFPRAHQPSQTIESFTIKAKRLANLARRRAPAIGDDIGRHRRAKFSVALINVLNSALALIAAGKIEIDVGPLAPLLRQKAFEEQPHTNRVHSSDAQRIADRAVRR